MACHVMNIFLLFAAVLPSTNAYWLMGIEDFIATERIDPIVTPGKVSSHVHSILGGSNFGFNTNTAALRASECTSVPIPQDKSNYWFPHLYFQWSNGSFSSLTGGAVVDEPGVTTAFPDDFRMLSGDPTLRTYDPNSFAQQAVTFLCLNFDGVTTRHNSIPNQACKSGIRSQINFPSCWDGKNLDSSDHKSHVAFPSEGPDKGTCNDPRYPFTFPRLFIEIYWASDYFDQYRSQAMNTTQPFVFSYGDRTGYGYHADYINGWDKGVLQNAVNKCNCNAFGDADCCVKQGIFDMNKGKSCRITKSVNETTTGILDKLPGNNPIQPEGTRATMFPDNTKPQVVSPVYVYTGDTPAATGKVLVGDAPVFPSSTVSSSPPGTVAGPTSPGSANSNGATSSIVSQPSTSFITPSSFPSTSQERPSVSSSISLATTSTHAVLATSTSPVSEHSSPFSSPLPSASPHSTTNQGTPIRPPSTHCAQVPTTRGSSAIAPTYVLPPASRPPLPPYSAPSPSASLSSSVPGQVCQERGHGRKPREDVYANRVRRGRGRHQRGRRFAQVHARPRF